ncbi:MAG: TIGR03905 family TSCPD domain-containing protein [Oscillospiraceae bacterium]|nr:TIGR03905 family TSCPD domain-containing protein [Oscillospiraceae bacterium]
MTYNFTPKGVCSRNITVELSDDGVIENVSFLGGCNGNLQGISSLVKGMKADEAISRLKGINCSGRGTSCPDQLSKALEAALSAH